MITASELRRVLRYEPGTGKFFWLVRMGQRAHAGACAGALHKHEGYVNIKIHGQEYKAHRLAWLYMTGEWPVEVDHFDGLRSNNRWANLRHAAKGVNVQNQRRPQRNNRSGFLGVSWHSVMGKWQAKITANKKRHLLGYFTDPAEAYSAYVTAKRSLHQFNTI